MFSSHQMPQSNNAPSSDKDQDRKKRRAKREKKRRNTKQEIYLRTIEVLVATKCNIYLMGPNAQKLLSDENNLFLYQEMQEDSPYIAYYYDQDQTSGKGAEYALLKTDNLKFLKKAAFNSFEGNLIKYNQVDPSKKQNTQTHLLNNSLNLLECILKNGGPTKINKKLVEKHTMGKSTELSNYRLTQSERLLTHQPSELCASNNPDIIKATLQQVIIMNGKEIIIGEFIQSIYEKRDRKRKKDQHRRKTLNKELKSASSETLPAETAANTHKRKHTADEQNVFHHTPTTPPTKKSRQNSPASSASSLSSSSQIISGLLNNNFNNPPFPHFESNVDLTENNDVIFTEEEFTQVSNLVDKLFNKNKAIIPNSSTTNDNAPCESAKINFKW